ncbi:Aste57867_1461 [Aphanomyces stellatus]|uniref:Aste57867_1461 protein n=1 Tax=Aphanomyces stellatus TaxID=120398 RepID=A0A485K8M0_9STRA|nr:hypothetical protein As57867_001460 [Aphanomyces stellatus]VFT78678.1 Aste57867_1461 [Aphanomyces stellatus]
MAEKTVGVIQETQDTVVETKQDLPQKWLCRRRSSFYHNIQAKKDDNCLVSEKAVKDVVGFNSNKLHGVSASLVKAVKDKNPLAGAKAVFDGLVNGQHLYFYLVDDVTNSVVEADDKYGVYPIKINTKTKQYTKFMATNLPDFQKGYQVLKGANTVAGFFRTLGLPSMSEDMKASVENLLDVNGSSVEDFDVVQEALERAQEDAKGKQVDNARGSALRE